MMASASMASPAAGAATNRAFKAHVLHAVALFAWFASVEIPLWFASDLTKDFAQPELDFSYAAISVAGLLVSLLLLSQRAMAVLRSTEPQMIAMWIVAGLITVVSVLTLRVVALANVAIMVFLALNMRLLWSLPTPIARGFFRALTVLGLATMLLPLAWYGMQYDRWIGGIHPNSIGIVGIATCFWAFLGFRRYAWVALGIAFAMAALVSSRFAIVSIALFGMAMAARAQLPPLAKIAAGIIGLAGGVLVMTSSALDALLRLSDRQRGIGSGLTGREDLWRNFTPQFNAEPLLGYGFRMRDDYIGAHNVYLDTLLENGVIIGTLILLLTMIWTAYWIVGLLTRPHTQEQAVIGAGLAILLFIGFFNPQLINFGDATGLAFMQLIVAPMALWRGGASATVPLRRTGPPGHAFG